MILFKELKEHEYYNLRDGAYAFIEKLQFVNGRYELIVWDHYSDGTGWDGPFPDSGYPDNAWSKNGVWASLEDFNCPEFQGFPRVKPNHPRMIWREEAGKIFAVTTTEPLKANETVFADPSYKD